MAGEVERSSLPDMADGEASLDTGNNDALSPHIMTNGDAGAPSAAAPLSKNQQKKLRRKQEWEDGRDDRKVKRKEKTKERRERRRAVRDDGAPTGAGEDSAPSTLPGTKGAIGNSARPHRAIQQPITFVFDCQYNDLMTEGELISLGAQLTRSYSDNRKGKFKAHLAISSFGGKLKERFEGILAGHHESWKGVRFLAEDFVVAAEQAKGWMKGPEGGKLDGALAQTQGDQDGAVGTGDGSPGEVIYLSSDSPDTLTELKPNSTYIIGGLVDRNRHKGICYKHALDAGVRTAKLPIGELMQMSSRQVLATNHVAEIMVKWLEFGDWGKAFVEVIPKRKGGVLKGKNGAEDAGAGADGPDGAEEEEKDNDEDEGGVQLLAATEDVAKRVGNAGAAADGPNLVEEDMKDIDGDEGGVQLPSATEYLAKGLGKITDANEDIAANAGSATLKRKPEDPLDTDQDVKRTKDSTTP